MRAPSRKATPTELASWFCRAVFHDGGTACCGKVGAVVQEHYGNVCLFKVHQIGIGQFAPEEQSVHLPGGEVLDEAALCPQRSLGVRQQEGVAPLGRGVLDGAGERGEKTDSGHRG